jgi:hypothetical protein
MLKINDNMISNADGYLFKKESSLQRMIHDNPEIVRMGIPKHYRPEELNSIIMEYKALDNLFIDENGILYLVEVKRATDSRLRREVMSQILDYGSIINKTTDNYEMFFKTIKESFDENNLNVNQELNSILKRHSEDLISNFNRCVEEGKFRLIILADKVAPELVELCDYTFNRTLNYSL